MDDKPDVKFENIALERQDSGIDSVSGSTSQRPMIKSQQSVISTVSSCGSGLDVDGLQDPHSSDEHRQWGNKLDFIMSCISYAVGLGNVWRFPYKVYKNGGAAFIIPYLICWLFVGVPLFFFETAIGQYLQQGAFGMWKAVPMMKGVGYAAAIICFLVSVYYAVVIAWALLYLFSSMQGELPWKNCGHSWNTESCMNMSYSYDHNTTGTNLTDSVHEFWQKFVLGDSGSLSNFGEFQWPLFGTLLLAWILVYFIIWKGLHSSGKVVWFTALFPYVLILALLVEAATLPGAANGMKFYLGTIDVEKLYDPNVWSDAFTQVLYSYGVGFTTLIALGCYNKYHHNCQRDAVIVGFVNSGTSILAGCVVFMSLGFMAEKQGVDISQVAEQGPGLVFLTYPSVFLNMPVSQLWSVLFFVMVLMLGIDSQFCQVEGFVACLEDEYPAAFKKHKRKLTLGICILFFLLALPQVDGGGIYLFTLMDTMAASGASLLWVIFWEAVAMMYMFGYKRIFAGLEDMIGHKNPPLKYTKYWWGFCWCIAVPVLSAAVFLFFIAKFEPLQYNTYVFTSTGQVIGWLMSATSMVCVPGYALYYIIFKQQGSLSERIRKGMTSEIVPRNERDKARKEQFASGGSFPSVETIETVADKTVDFF